MVKRVSAGSDRNPLTARRKRKIELNAFVGKVRLLRRDGPWDGHETRTNAKQVLRSAECGTKDRLSASPRRRRKVGAAECRSGFAPFALWVANCLSNAWRPPGSTMLHVSLQYRTPGLRNRGRKSPYAAPIGPCDRTRSGRWRALSELVLRSGDEIHLWEASAHAISNLLARCAARANWRIRSVTVTRCGSEPPVWRFENRMFVSQCSPSLISRLLADAGVIFQATAGTIAILRSAFFIEREPANPRSTILASES